jgi:2Fe-2S ferredoxin
VKVVVSDRDQQQSEYVVGDIAELFGELSGEMKIEALCGGWCSCATCHVYLNEADTHAMSAVADDEKAALEGLMHVSDKSRLLCQLKMQKKLDHLEITIAPSE